MPIKEYFFSIRKYSERDNRCEHQLLKKMPLLLNRLKMTVSFYNPCFIFNCLHSINIVINRCELCNIKCPFTIQKRRETMMILVSMFYLIHFLKRDLKSTNLKFTTIFRYRKSVDQKNDIVVEPT